MDTNLGRELFINEMLIDDMSKSKPYKDNAIEAALDTYFNYEARQGDLGQKLKEEYEDKIKNLKDKIEVDLKKKLNDGTVVGFKAQQVDINQKRQDIMSVPDAQKKKIEKEVKKLEEKLKADITDYKKKHDNATAIREFEEKIKGIPLDAAEKIEYQKLKIFFEEIVDVDSISNEPGVCENGRIYVCFKEAYEKAKAFLLKEKSKYNEIISNYLKLIERSTYAPDDPMFIKYLKYIRRKIKSTYEISTYLDVEYTVDADPDQNKGKMRIDNKNVNADGKMRDGQDTDNHGVLDYNNGVLSNNGGPLPGSFPDNYGISPNSNQGSQHGNNQGSQPISNFTTPSTGSQSLLNDGDKVDGAIGDDNNDVNGEGNDIPQDADDSNIEAIAEEAAINESLEAINNMSSLSNDDVTKIAEQAAIIESLETINNMSSDDVTKIAEEAAINESLKNIKSMLVSSATSPINSLHTDNNPSNITKIAEQAAINESLQKIKSILVSSATSPINSLHTDNNPSNITKIAEQAAINESLQKIKSILVSSATSPINSLHTDNNPSNITKIAEQASIKESLQKIKSNQSTSTPFISSTSTNLPSISVNSSGVVKNVAETAAINESLRTIKSMPVSSIASVQITPGASINREKDRGANKMTKPGTFTTKQPRCQNGSRINNTSKRCVQKPKCNNDQYLSKKNLCLPKSNNPKQNNKATNNPKQNRRKTGGDIEPVIPEDDKKQNNNIGIYKLLEHAIPMTFTNNHSIDKMSGGGVGGGDDNVLIQDLPIDKKNGLNSIFQNTLPLNLISGGGGAETLQENDKTLSNQSLENLVEKLIDWKYEYDVNINNIKSDLENIESVKQEYKNFSDKLKEYWDKFNNDNDIYSTINNIQNIDDEDYKKIQDFASSINELKSYVEEGKTIFNTRKINYSNNISVFSKFNKSVIESIKSNNTNLNKFISSKDKLDLISKLRALTSKETSILQILESESSRKNDDIYKKLNEIIENIRDIKYILDKFLNNNFQIQPPNNKNQPYNKNQVIINNFNTIIRRNRSITEGIIYINNKLKNASADYNSQSINLENNKKDITNIIDKYINLIQKRYLPTIRTAIENQDGDKTFGSKYNKIWNKYIENINDEDKLLEESRDRFYTSFKSSGLDPSIALVITRDDKVLFIIIAFVIRQITLHLVETLIDRGVLTSFYYSIVSFLAVYVGIIVLIVLIINLDDYKLRIVFNFFNMHINSSGIFGHIFMMICFSGLLFILVSNMATSTQFDKPTLTEIDKLNLSYKMELITIAVLTISVVIMMVL